MPLRPGRLGLVLLLLALASMPQATAADAVDIEAVVGFGDIFRPGHWTPLTVMVSNRGGNLDGELEVQVTADDASRGRQLATYHRRLLELHGDSRKRLQFTVLPQGLFHPLVIRVRAGGQEVARAEIDLRTRFAAQRLLVVLGRDADLDYLNESSVDGVRVLYPHPELLPGHWRGYDAVAAIVLHGVSLEQLSAAQFEALQKWIAQGGVLAVSGGADYGVLKSTRLSALLPAVPSGMIALDAEALQGAFLDKLHAVGRVHVHRIGSVRGQVRLRAGEVPLIVERKVGLGRVLYLTFDVASDPFDAWQGMRGLWLEMLQMVQVQPPATVPSSVPERMTGSALAALIHEDAADFPRYSAAFLFLALYLGLLLVGFAVPLRGKPRRWLAPFCGWAAPVLFAPIAWLLFGPGVFPRGASTATVALIEPLPQSGYARLNLELGVYANRNGPLRLEYRGADPVLYPHRMAGQENRLTNWMFGQGSRPFVEPLDPRRYVLHVLEGEDVIEFRLDAAVNVAPAGTRLSVRNAAGRNLEDAWLVFEGRAYRLGSVAAGARLERALIASEAIQVSADSWRRLLRASPAIAIHRSGPEQILLEHKSKAMGERGFPGRGHALLIGYTESPLRPAGSSADWPWQERALVAYRFAVPAHDADPAAVESGRLDRGNDEARSIQEQDAAAGTAYDGANDAKQSARH